MKKKYYWCEESGIAQCIITTKEGKTFLGDAICHEDDMDMKSEKTGLTIAEYRAYIRYLQDEKNNVIIPQLNMLKHLIATMETSKNFSSKHYEAKMIYRKLNQTEEDLMLVKHAIDELKSDLAAYLRKKEAFYTMIREYREKGIINTKDLTN